MVEENNELLLQLISDILDLSKIEAGTFDFKIRDLDVNTLCGDVQRSMKLRVKPGVELLFEPTLPSCVIVSDPNRLHQVVANFVNNAISSLQPAISVSDMTNRMQSIYGYMYRIRVSVLPRKPVRRYSTAL